jgi:hypothetical protein
MVIFFFQEFLSILNFRSAENIIYLLCREIELFDYEEIIKKFDSYINESNYNSEVI